MECDGDRRLCESVAASQAALAVPPVQRKGGARGPSTRRSLIRRRPGGRCDGCGLEKWQQSGKNFLRLSEKDEVIATGKNRELGFWDLPKHLDRVFGTHAIAITLHQQYLGADRFQFLLRKALELRPH